MFLIKKFTQVNKFKNIIFILFNEKIIWINFKKNYFIIFKKKNNIFLIDMYLMEIHKK